MTLQSCKHILSSLGALVWHIGPPKSLGTQKPKAASWSVTSASAAASLLALSGALAQVIP